MLYNVVVVSAIHQHESVIIIYIYVSYIHFKQFCELVDLNTHILRLFNL